MKLPCKLKRAPMYTGHITGFKTATVCNKSIRLAVVKWDSNMGGIPLACKCENNPNVKGFPPAELEFDAELI